MTQGRKEVGEAVLIATLSALVGGLITWGFDECKKRVNDARERKKKEEDEQSTSSEQ